MKHDTTLSFTCTSCGKTYPRTTEYWRLRGEAAGGGLTSRCKQCISEYRKAWRHAKSEAGLEDRLRLQEQKRAAMRERRLAKKRAYYADNKERAKERAKAWREQNRESHLEKKRQYDKATRERDFEKRRAYRAQNKDHIAKYMREWRERNRDKKLIIYHRYEARKRSAVGGHTTEDVANIRALQNNECRYCGIELTERVTPNLDHFIPLSEGGSNNPDNLVWSCHSCNTSKKNKLPWAWRNWNGALPVLFEKDEDDD
jgi:5-methylcytosine-specific restriction endonuclease McrA/DNA-directed RNA polymerase subunit RPC12/RpoP